MMLARDAGRERSRGRDRDLDQERSRDQELERGRDWGWGWDRDWDRTAYPPRDAEREVVGRGIVAWTSADAQLRL